MKMLRFIYALIKYLIIGNTVNKTVYNARISLCKSCKYLNKDTCGVCECFVKHKAKWSTEYCPKHFW